MEEEVLSTTIGPKLAPFNPSHEDVVNLALDMMAVRSDDLVYDLGCGDGRVLVQACRRFPEVRGVGVEYDLAVAQRAQKLTEDQELTDRISIIHGNALDIDFSTATAIFLYLLPAGMKALKERLVQALERGVRIVSYVFSIPEVEPFQVSIYKSSTKVYLYKKKSIDRDTEDNRRDSNTPSVIG